MRYPANRDISKSPLTKPQKELIDNNYNELKKILTYIYKDENKALEALRFLPEITLKYSNYNKKDKMKFINYAYQMCVKKNIDEFRHVHKTHLNKQFLSIDGFKNEFSCVNEEIDSIDWEDLKNTILKKSDEFFPADEDKRKNKSNIFYKYIIKEYLIPKCEGQKISYETIASQLRCKKQWVHKLVRSDKMKEFIEFAYQKNKNIKNEKTNREYTI